MVESTEIGWLAAEIEVMRLPRVRFTVRRMMVAVLVAGALLSLVARRERFKRLADYHEAMHYRSAIQLVDVEYQETIFGPTPRSTWHMKMAQKYDRAAARPWLPLAPDPPCPK